jgi:hypothetical protein
MNTEKQDYHVEKLNNLIRGEDKDSAETLLQEYCYHSGISPDNYNIAVNGNGERYVDAKPHMQTCNMDERTNEEKLLDQIEALQSELEALKGDKWISVDDAPTPPKE